MNKVNRFNINATKMWRVKQEMFTATYITVLKN